MTPRSLSDSLTAAPRLSALGARPRSRAVNPQYPRALAVGVALLALEGASACTPLMGDVAPAYGDGGAAGGAGVAQSGAAGAPAEADESNGGQGAATDESSGGQGGDG